MDEDPLATYLDSLARDDCYRVTATLKESAREVTEVVYFQGANRAELGPFVRKRFLFDDLGEPPSESSDAPSSACPRPSLGDAYRVLYQAQRAGRRFLHLPRIYDMHKEDNDLVVIMEYVAGRTLREEVYERDPSPELAMRWFPLLCDGVTELHGAFQPPLIHRDLKPTNVIVSEQGLVIVDLGIARTYRPDAEGDTVHLGTRAYAPPEQFGYGQTDVRSDVYALGLLLYYLLTERDPSPAIVRNGFVDPEIPSALRPVLVRACAFDPAARFTSAAQLKTAFLEAVAAPCPASGSSPYPATNPAPAPMPPVAPPTPGTPSAPTAPAHLGAADMHDNEQPPLLSKRTIITIILWALFIICTMTLPFDPPPEKAGWPLPLLMLYYGYAIPFFTGAAVLIAGSPFVRRILHCSRKKARIWTTALGLGLVAVGIVVIGISGTIARSLGLE